MDNRKIIQVKPTDDWYDITWVMSIRCNQDCCYCPNEYHSADGKLYNLDEFKEIWLDIFKKTQHFNLKYKLSFTGGEVTIQKSFLPFLEWLYANYKERIGLSILSSNGTASANYYLRAFEHIDNLSISVHSEFIDEKKFFKKIVTINETLPPGKFFHVNVMDEPWNRDRREYYEQILKDNNIYYSVNFLHDFESKNKAYIPIIKGDLNFDLSKPSKLQL